MTKVYLNSEVGSNIYVINNPDKFDLSTSMLYYTIRTKYTIRKPSGFFPKTIGEFCNLGNLKKS
jgi:hypothetical protein